MPRIATVLAVAGIVLTATLVGGVAWATIPDDNGLYTACKLNATGTIRLIDPSGPTSSLLSRCTIHETKISWNQNGRAGAIGAAGPVGPAGMKGDAGPAGPQGSKGDAGTAGTNGPQGPAGPAGADGTNGVDGAQGTPGRDGIDGKDGINGTNGLDGAPGTDGEDGEDGEDGVSVTTGVEPAGTNCANGGSKLTAADGVTYACNGSNGTGGTTGQDSTTVFGTAALNATTANHTLLPGLSQTITVPPNAKVYVSADGGFAPATSTPDAISVVDIDLVVDNQLVANAGYRRGAAKNQSVTNGAVTVTIGFVNWAFSTSLSLPAGTHTIAVEGGLTAGAGSLVSPTGATISGNSSSVLQGQLTVVILKT
jgi:collagen triple helix repeat protein